MSVTEITNIFIYRQLATSLVILEYKGIEYRLCALTNLYLAQMNEFVNVFFQGRGRPEERQKKKKPDSEELYCPRCGTMYPDPVRKICPKCMNKRSIFTRTLRLFLEVPCKDDSSVFLLHFFGVYKHFMAVFEWYGVI